MMKWSMMEKSVVVILVERIGIPALNVLYVSPVGENPEIRQSNTFKGL